MTHIARGEFLQRVGEKWGSMFRSFLFCFREKKEKIKWSIELLQLGQMERTVEDLIPIHTHRYIHAWAILVQGSLNSASSNIFVFISLNLTEGTSRGAVIVLNPKYLWHYVIQPAVLGTLASNKFQTWIVCDEEGQSWQSHVPPPSHILVKLLWPKRITSRWWQCFTSVFIVNGFRVVLLDMGWKLLRGDPF